MPTTSLVESKVRKAWATLPLRVRRSNPFWTMARTRSCRGSNAAVARGSVTVTTRTGAGGEEAGNSPLADEKASRVVRYKRLRFIRMVAFLTRRDAGVTTTD